MYNICISLAFLMLSQVAAAQVLPREGSAVNYRIIGFSDSMKPGCMLEIAAGSYNTEDSFLKNIIITHAGNRAIVEVPFFGRQYTWRTTYVDGSVKGSSALHHFSTAHIADVDTDNTRLRVTVNKHSYDGAFVFSDGHRMIYDMNGHPVWFMPTIEGLTNESLRDVRDMKLSPRGTITFLLNNVPYEINYDGDVLWKAPNVGAISKDTTEHFHHEFTRLENGHYMVLGSERVSWELPATADSSMLMEDNTTRDSTGHSFHHKIEFGTIIEYDGKGHIVWSWRSATYFKRSDLKDVINTNRKYQDVHENSFFLDEKNKIIYVSFRNISRILKINYPAGNVVSAYGNRYKPGIKDLGNDLFCNQHSCKRARNGDLYLFNNNCCNKGAPPGIVRMREPLTGKGSLRKMWEYTCSIEGMPPGRIIQFKSGGNVVELPDNSFFASMSTDLYSNLFIVDKDKKILWSAVPEKWNQVAHKWEVTYQYRTNIIIDEKQKEQLIWDASLRE